jgi:phosphatidylglycerophosphatase A
MEKGSVPQLRACLLNLYGLGKLPFSASLASVVAVLMYVAVAGTVGMAVAWLLLVPVGALTLWDTARNREAALADLKEIVLDELVGMYLCLLIVGRTDVTALMAGLVLFRAIDLLKPPPFNYLDRHLKGSMAYMWDDVAIGVVIGLAIRAMLGPA